jgi:hypothetical protein
MTVHNIIYRYLSKQHSNFTTHTSLHKWAWKMHLRTLSTCPMSYIMLFCLRVHLQAANDFLIKKTQKLLEKVIRKNLYR